MWLQNDAFGDRSPTSPTGYNAPVRRPVPQRRVQPREAMVNRREDTQSLADFFKDTMPPPVPEKRPSTREKEKEESGMSKLKNMAKMRKSKKRDNMGVVY